MAYRRTEKMAARLAGKRAQILRAAQDLAAEDGWGAVQIANVATRAGIATGTVYRYWPSKTELCTEIVATVSAHEVGIVRSISETDAEPAAKLKSAIMTFGARALRGRRLAYAMIAEPVDPDVEAARLKYRALLADCFERILREGIMRGAFSRLDPAVLAACIVGALMEALIGPLAPSRGDDPQSENHLVEQIAAFCLRVSIADGQAG